MKDLGEVDTILGIKVKKHSGGFSLCQSHYIDKIISKFNHLGIKEANTPLDVSTKLVENSGRFVSQLDYASAIGSLMYAMHCTRPIFHFLYASFQDIQVIIGLNIGGLLEEFLVILKGQNHLPCFITNFLRY